MPGARYLDTQEFRPGHAGPTTATILSALPATDAKGRTVDEVDLNVGFARKHPAPPDMEIADKHMWVRIGAVWGYLDTGTRKFWPSAVDRGTLAKWEDRVVTKDGYAEGGTSVPGRWYRPLPPQPRAVPVGEDGSHEWARSQDDTGSGKGTGHTVADRAKVRSGFDPATL